MYLHVGEKSVLMVNLLDDKALELRDFRSKTLALNLLSDSHGTAKIKKEELSLPLVVSSREYFMGDVTRSAFQPLQYYPEINVVQGEKAYRKTLPYTKTNIFSHLSNCTIFADFTHRDSKEYIACSVGEDTCSLLSSRLMDKKLSINNLYGYVGRLRKINPTMKVYLCGIDLELLNSFSIAKCPNLILIFSARTLVAFPQIYDRLVADRVNYILILDLTTDVTTLDLDTPLELWGKLSEEKAVYNYQRLVKLGKRIRPFVVKNEHNLNLTKELLTFTKGELLNIKNKFQVIKTNNLINTNFWGHIYVFPDGTVSFSLLEDRAQSVDIERLQEEFKKLFFRGNFSWTQLREYDKCQKCAFQYLCPSPSNLETVLRKEIGLECLLRKESE